MLCKLLIYAGIAQLVELQLPTLVVAGSSPVSCAMKMPVNILFLCTGNSCRSQMAEGWARALYPSSVIAYSAGTKAHGLNPRAVQVMAEAGVDISRHQSRSIEELPKISFDVVVTVCDNARESCPVFHGSALRIHHSFDDPPLHAEGFPEQQALDVYRRVRDEIRTMVEGLDEYVCHAAKQR